MRPLSRSTVTRALRHGWAVPLLCASLGCTTWRPVALPVPQDSTWSAGGELRLRTTDGLLVHGAAMTMAGDTLRVADAHGATIARVSRTGTSGIEVRRFDGVKTVVFLASLMAVTLALGAAIGNSFDGFGGGGYGY